MTKPVYQNVVPEPELPGGDVAYGFRTGGGRMNMTVPTQADKNGWSELATWAYRNDNNDIGHRYSVAASLPENQEMVTCRFEALQHGHKMWKKGEPEFIPNFRHTS